MKKLFSISLVALLLSLACSAQAAKKDLLPGDYTLRAYTLSNGDPVSQQASSAYNDVGFHSLYIFSDAMDTVLNRDEAFYTTSQAGIGQNRFQGMAIKAAYSPTSNITFHSSLGLTDTSANERLAYTERIGWELDLGMAYKFLNKFAYEVHFGYMDTGELFTESNRYTDVEDITIVTNKLTMSF